MPAVSILAKAPLFSALDEKTLSYFERGSHRKKYTKGANIFLVGDRAEHLYFVADGWVKLYRMTRDGEETIIHVFAPGETFAEAAVFNPVQRYPVSAQAVEETAVIEIPRQLFVDKIRENGDFALLMLGSISARQHLLVQQIEQITTKSAAQRIGTFLLRNCRLEKENTAIVLLPYDKSLIARRLNIQPETFSRALIQLKEHGVTADKRQVTLGDVSRLASYCEADEREKPY